MKIKAKWYMTIVSPWAFPFGLSALFAARYGFPLIEQRVLMVVGTFIYMGIMLGIVQPWKEDVKR